MAGKILMFSPINSDLSNLHKYNKPLKCILIVHQSG